MRNVSTFRVLALLVALGMSTTARVAAQEISDEERRLLEESLATDLAEAGPTPSPASVSPTTAMGGSGRAFQSMNPDISLILDFAGAWFSAEEPLQGGAHDPRETGFNLQQLEMSIGSNVDPFFRFDANLVFSQFGVEVEEAYVTTLALPAGLQLRGGQFLTRFGRLNNTHPHTWHFVDQPLVNGKFFGGEGSRGLGLELSWLAPLPWYMELIASTNQAVGECCARSYWGAEDLGVDDPRDLMTTTALKQFFPFTVDWSLLLGLSGQFGPNPTGNGNRSEIYGADLYLRWRPTGDPERRFVALTVEGMLRRRQVPNDVLQDWGGYASLVWQLAKRWECGARAELVSGLGDDYLDPDWTGQRQRYAAQLTFYPSHFSRIRLQGGPDLPSWRDEVDWAVLLAVEVVTGAHGAHAY